MADYINPYNFVPFGEKLDEKNTKTKKDVYRGKKQKELLSGWINVGLLTKTPLIIPDGAHFEIEKINNKGKTEEHKKYSFQKLYNPRTKKNEYAIPGSSLRGMIRNNYEMVTNSCVPVLKDDKPMSQRIPLYAAMKKRGLFCYENKEWVLYSTTNILEEVLVIPCYEEEGKYYIQNSKDKNGRIQTPFDRINNNGDSKYSILKDKLKNGEIKFKNKSVFFDPDKIKDRPWTEYIFINEEGKLINKETGSKVTMDNSERILQYNVPVNKDRVYHVAYLKKDKVEKKWEEDSAAKFLKSALMRDGSGKKSKDNDNKSCNKALLNCLNNNMPVPVYYFTVKKRNNETEVYMSGSACGRIAQHRKWKEILVGHTPCNKETMCPACLLFGNMNEKYGLKGHLRFTDAFAENGESIKTKMHTLPILGLPRTSAFEFYLEKPEEKGVTYWNFDFYGKCEEKGEGTEYKYLEESKPRGRKMYWHHAPVEDAEKNKLNETVESIGEETKFQFRIYFDQITKGQLEDLIWVISAGENKKDGKFCLKLGHAKPLGYGSIKLFVKSGKIRTFEQTGEGFAYQTKELKDIIDFNLSEDSDINKNSKSVKNFLKMCEFDALKDSKAFINYPQNGGKIFKWFASNRTNPAKLRVLPNPLQSDQSLPGN